MLAAHLIEQVRQICHRAKDKRVLCVYFYCYHGHNQDETLPFVRWLLSQLFRKANTIPGYAQEIFQEPDLTALLPKLEETLHYFDTGFVMIDALDESWPLTHILSFLQFVMTNNQYSKIQLFATSREYAEIRRTMSAIAEPLSLSSRLVESDIRHYVLAEIASNPAFRLWSGDLQAEVAEALSKAAEGMFRWAACQLDILRRLKDQRMIRDVILGLPETLDETYARIFSYIFKDDRGLVQHAIHWVCFHNILWQTAAPLAASVLVDA